MKLLLTERRIEVPGVESFIFQPQEPLSWKPGQYFHYVLHHEPTDDRGSDRWFTCAAAPSEKEVRITTRFAAEKGSSFKKALADMKVGKKIEISYVEGDFTVEDLSQEYVFIAGGIGITPFRSILKELDAHKQQPAITLLYASRDQNIVYKEELGSFAKNNPNLKVHYVVSPQRIDVAKVQEFVPDLQRPLLYVSGPEPMVLILIELLKGAGIPPEHLKQDDFPGYPAD